MTATELLVWGSIAHLIADWFLQNDWQAVNKTNLLHPAAWLHSGCHAACLAFVFPWYVALFLGAAHLLIDTRVPLECFRQAMGQAKEGNPVAVHVKIWQDQAAHILCIAACALIIDG